MGTARGAVQARVVANAITVAIASGCGPPDVDALAVWLDGEVRASGGRNLRIYDRGDATTIPVEPGDVGANAGDDLTVRAAPRGRGVALSTPEETAWVGLVDGRRGSIDPSLAPVELSFVDAFAITPTGDMLWRWFFDESTGDEPLPRGIALLPLASDAPATWVPVPQPIFFESTFVLLPAPDAAVAYWVEQLPGSDLLGGRVRAFAYPSDIGGAAPVVPAPTVLADGEIQVGSPGFPPDAGESACPRSVCVAPDGDVLLANGTLVCTLSRWSWREAATSGDDVGSETMALPRECPVNRVPTLVAALDDDVVVLEDPDAVHVADLSAGTWSTTPKPGEGAGTRALVSRGRALVFVGNDSGVVRVDAEGGHAWTTEHVGCPVDERTVVSPDGQWVVRSCSSGTITDRVPLPGALNFDPFVVRVSPLGAELHVGAIALLPLAVDDHGNALLYSHERNDSEPRGLFVLGPDGGLSRIDELEPTPQSFLVEVDRTGYFSAEPVP